MLNWHPDDEAYNRFSHLDSIEDRIIFYLLSDKNKSPEQIELTHNLWRLMYYSDERCLIDDSNHPLPSFKEIYKLVDNDNTVQNTKRIFRYPYIEESFTEQCSLISVYVDTILPRNHLIADVNIGIDILIHNKISNVVNPLYREDGELINSTEGFPLIKMKNRATMLLRIVLALLNGADVAGVGKFQFNRELNRFVQSKLGLWNNRNFYGHKIIIPCQMSGVE